MTEREAAEKLAALLNEIESAGHEVNVPDVWWNALTVGNTALRGGTHVCGGWRVHE